MNFKRKLWWAQHKNDVYKYSTFILLFLVVTISIIYFTYSKFSTSNEMTMYETTVEPFIKNDYFIASYIDGEWSNEIPSKNDGYVVDKIICDNGATGTWDYSTWSINVSNATKKIKCGVYFVTGSLIDVELYQGLIPVTYNSSGDVVVADTNTKWYDYSNHEWANAVLVNCADSTIKSKYFNDDMSLKSSVVGSTISMDEILQMYVYIPRYRYKLFNANNGTSEEQAVDIIFEKVGTEKSNGTKNGEWLTHPAFTFGNTELPGIWVGKFETSGTSSLPKMIPNATIITQNSLSTSFNIARSITTSLNHIFGTSNLNDSHIIKNMEWGAVAFLTTSIYGRYNDISTCIDSGCEVWINNNSNFIAGCSGSSVSDSPSSSCNEWNSKIGVNASTTGNQYGIYDMSGGAWEYVMGNYMGKIANSGFSTLPDEKYFDKYVEVSSSNDFGIFHLGDATREVLKNVSIGQNCWYEDSNYLADQESPWYGRGGRYDYETAAGIFRIGLATGRSGHYDTFRSVITAS